MPGRTKVRKEKVEAADRISKIAEKSPSMILTSFRGMSVKQMTELRRGLKPTGGKFKVIKNTLSRRALSGFEDFQKLLAGPVAVLFIEGDPVAPAKQLVGFIKDNEKPEILGGLIESKFFKKEDVVKLSKLPSREELLAKMLASFNSPIYGFVNVLAGNIRKLVYVLNAIKEVK